MTQTKAILENYAGESPGLLANLARFLNAGALAGTGKMVILPVDQGVEHGPGASFAPNPDGYDPAYHVRLAIDGGLSGFACPLGMMEVCASEALDRIPRLLKLNSATVLTRAHDQSVMASPRDALRLGCQGIGLTIYPGADKFEEMLEEASEPIAEARDLALPTFIWAYPRGGTLTKDGETALDVTAYAAYVAASVGAHVIKLKPPTAHIELTNAGPAYADWAPKSTLAERIAHVRQAAYAGRRLVIFSGGARKDDGALLEEIAAIHEGGGGGSIIGRNVFQRPREEALALIAKIIAVYRAA